MIMNDSWRMIMEFVCYLVIWIRSNNRKLDLWKNKMTQFFPYNGKIWNSEHLLLYVGPTWSQIIFGAKKVLKLCCYYVYSQPLFSVTIRFVDNPRFVDGFLALWKCIKRGGWLYFSPFIKQKQYARWLVRFWHGERSLAFLRRTRALIGSNILWLIDLQNESRKIKRFKKKL